MADRVAFDRLNDIIHKAAGKHGDGLSFGDGTGLQVKDLILIELTDCGSVRALNVIGKNFQLRLGVDPAIFAEDQIFVQLIGVGQLGDRPDKDFAIKNTFS